MNEELYKVVMDELAVLISDTDLHISQLVLTLLGTVMDNSPSSIKEVSLIPIFLFSSLFPSLSLSLPLSLSPSSLPHSPSLPPSSLPLSPSPSLPSSFPPPPSPSLPPSSPFSPSLTPSLPPHQVHTSILPNTLTLVLSSLLQGSAMTACLQFFAKLVKLRLPGLGFQDLFQVHYYAFSHNS